MRVFIAIKVPEAIKEEISELQRDLDAQNVRWVAPKNIHLTLKFLGEVPDGQIEAIADAMKSSLPEIKPFNISFEEEVDGFPNLNRPRVLWIGVKQGKVELIELMQKLNRELSSLGFVAETRKSVPHLTIGRVKKVGRGFGLATLKVCPTFLAERVYLIKSELTPQGPIYTDIKEFRL